jgi:2-methylcitrate dehydratase PrpD
MSITSAPLLGESIAAWVAQLALDRIPGASIAQAKRCLLDTLAVGWAGSAALGNAPLRDYVGASGGRPQATWWTRAQRVAVLDAAFINGVYAAALEYDTMHEVATVHPDIVLVPALLALAERERKSGREFLEAYIAGSEIMIRLGLAVEQNPGWFLTSVFGTFAAAAACAKLLGADAEGIHRALGIGLGRAAGSQQAAIERCYTKRMQSAMAARDGLEAALLAACGVTAPRQVFEGARAFERHYVRLDHGVVLDRLGSEYRLESLTFKGFPACFGSHAAILAAQDLHHRLGLRACDVAACQIALTPASYALAGAPFMAGDNAQVSAQFSAQYAVACALLRGGFDLADIEPERIGEPDVQALMRRVEVLCDSQGGRDFAPATITVRTWRGQTLTSRIDRIPGGSAAPFSDIQLRDKALRCFQQGATGVSRPNVPLLLDRIERLEEVETMCELFP